MASRDALWHAFVYAYDIEVSEEAIQNELNFIELDMRHRMQYQQLSVQGMHLFPDRELEQRSDELRELAIFEAKAPKVVKAIIAEQDLVVTPEELAAEAEAVAKRQNATMDVVKMFFGEDFSDLERDILERKAIDWAIEQAQ